MEKIELWQWWRNRDGNIRRVICVSDEKAAWPVMTVDKKGIVNTHLRDGSYQCGNPRNDLVEHLPDCDGFDWVFEHPYPRYPRWYTSNGKDVFRRDSLTEHTLVRREEEVKQKCCAKILDAFREISEQEAANILNPKTRTVVLRRYLCWNNDGYTIEQWVNQEPCWDHHYDTCETKEVEIPL